MANHQQDSLNGKLIYNYLTLQLSTSNAQITQMTYYHVYPHTSAAINVDKTEFFINSIIADSIPNSTTISRILKASRNDKTLCAVQLSLKSNKWFKNTKFDTL